MGSSILGAINSIGAIVVVFGLCLLCHEFGHFLFAKLFGMKVEEFAFGFGRALWKRQRGETTYRLNIFPYGAYVKIAGMEPGAVEVERGFHTRPRLQGMLVILGGSLFNLLLAIVLFSVVTGWTGVPDPNDQGIYVGKVVADGPAARAGIQPGDQIVAVDGQERSLCVATVSPGSLGAELRLRPGVFIERVDGKEVFLPEELVRALRASPGRPKVAVVDYEVKEISRQQRLLELTVPAELRRPSTLPATTLLARTLGLRFERLNQPTLVGYIANRVSQPVQLELLRESARVRVQTVTSVAHARYAMRDEKGMVFSRIKEVGRIGVVLRSATRPVGVGESIHLGWLKSLNGAMTVIASVKAMVNREVEAELAGPVAIMAISVERARIGWDAVLNWGGLISSILAMMNLFPIPPFDGFRAVLLVYEGIIRRRIDAQKELVLSIAGFIVIVFLFVVLTFKDVANLLRYGTP